MVRLWLSSPRVTSAVVIDDKGIVQAKDCPLIFKRFIGKHWKTLVWQMKIDKVEKL